MLSHRSWCCVRTLLCAQRTAAQLSRFSAQKSVICAERQFSANAAFRSDKTTSQTQHREKDEPETEKVEDSFAGEFRALTDATSEVVYDVIEQQQQEDVVTLPEDDPFSGYNLKRGVSGVFDISELPAILRREKAKDICVLHLPYEQYHVQHMIIVTVRSKLHLWALQEFLRKLYKRKMNKNDIIPFADKKQAGKGSKGNINWISLNLGNVIVHLMLADTREYYDIESLWAVGPDYDELMQVQEEKYTNLLQQLMSVDDFKPNINL